MSIDESTDHIGTLDVDDLAATAEGVAARGRAVVEFAAGADSQSLAKAHEAGQALIEQLMKERRRLLAEMRNARSLHDSLTSNVSEDSRPSSLLGATLLA